MNGGKGASGVVQKIISLMPPHRIFIEGFAGSAVITKRKEPADITILADLDGDVLRCNEFPGHFAAPVFLGRDQIEAEFITYSTFGHYYPKKIFLFHGNVFDLLGRGFNSAWNLDDILIYLDPPYPFDVRSCQKRLFNFEAGDWPFHEALLGLVLRLSQWVKIMVSSYENSIYNEALTGWGKEQFRCMSRGGVRTETVWYNFPRPVVLHDYRWIGKNFRDRERIKKYQGTIMKKLRSLSPIERNAMIKRIGEEFETSI
jgi:DNA adenine methylase